MKKKNERKGTARKLIVQSFIVVAVAVPSYFALDFGVDLGRAEDLAVTLSEAAKSHDDAVAEARLGATTAQDAKAAVVSLNDDLKEDLAERDRTIDKLRAEPEVMPAAPQGSCAEVRRRHAAEVEYRLARAACLRAWDPKERLWVGLAEGANDGQ